MNTRHAIRHTDTAGQVWFIHRLAPLTNPSWTQNRREARTWASRSGALANVRKYRLDTVSGTLDVVAVAR